jgi:hypothetical protein
MGTFVRRAAHAAGVGGVVVVVAAVAWAWGNESGYWDGLEEGHHGFLGESATDR